MFLFGPKHEREFRKGIVSKAGLEVLSGLYTYGNISAMGALETHFRSLYSASFSGKKLKVYDPHSKSNLLLGLSEFDAWRERYFPEVERRNIRNR